MKKRIKDKRPSKRFYYWKHCKYVCRSRWLNKKHFEQRRFIKINKPIEKHDPIIDEFKKVVDGWYADQGKCRKSFHDFKDVIVKASIKSPVLNHCSAVFKDEHEFIETPLYKTVRQYHHSLTIELKKYKNDGMLGEIFERIISHANDEFKTINENYDVIFEIERGYDYYEIIGTMIYYKEKE